ncbi:MAG: hypothetical protein P8J20_17335 [Novosphingobium sp.]|nr:hypothetical protein [Novosphingobium sp.]
MTMATVTENQPARPARRNTEPFGGAAIMAWLAISVTLIGFWNTFFAILPDVDLAHQLHGWTATGWLVLVLVQATLIRSHQYKLHRVLGWSSLVLFTLLLVSAWRMLAIMLSGNSHIPVPFDFAKLFALSDVTAVPLMIIAYGAAVVLRKDRHVHSRLISVTLLAGLLPAIARMFNLVFTGPEGLIFAMHPSYLFVLGVLAVAMFVDWRKGLLRWPFPFAFVWFVVAYATFFPSWHSAWFDAVAKGIAATY